MRVGDDWVSGVYLGKLTAAEGGWQSYVVFIVRDGRTADFLFQCSDNTWQAYNRWPSQFSLYDDGKAEWYWGGGVQVGYRRPYGKYCQGFIDGSGSIGAGEFLLFEFPLAYWMESLGYDLTYTSNLDTHRDPSGIANKPWRCPDHYGEAAKTPLRDVESKPGKQQLDFDIKKR